MKLRSVCVVAVAAMTLGGCAMVSSPTSGLVYTNVQGPLAVGNASHSAKSGQACATNILGILATGDASIDAAKQNGSITQVASVDHSSTSVLGLYGQFCTLVKGE